jgi:acetylornithine deacetylase/succinyl-diaminopimelate desuccinylase-like protein
MRRHGFAIVVLLISLATTSGHSEMGRGRTAMQAAVHPTAQLLSELIRIDTSNPPGHEQRIAEFLAPKFAALGLQTEIVPTPEAGKAGLFQRLTGVGSR